MRKYKIIGLVVLVLIVTVSTGVYSVTQNRRQEVIAREAAISEEERTKKLADWQAKVRMWEQQSQTQAQTTMTTSQSDLEEQGISVLPDTGPGHTAATFMLVTLLSTISYFLINKYIFNSYF